MEIRQFEAFAAVHASGSVTAAARLLDRSQPVVSRQLQDLENELGFTLFTRTRPQVTLTEQGREFLEEVRNVLSGLQQLEARSREIAEGRARPLRIATSLSVSHSLLPPVLAEIFERDPDFQNKLYIDVMPYGQIVSALQEGSADVAFTSLTAFDSSATLAATASVVWPGLVPPITTMPEFSISWTASSSLLGIAGTAAPPSASRSMVAFSLVTATPRLSSSSLVKPSDLPVDM